MKNPKIKTKVVHSFSKSAWNIVADGIECKFKIARVPYFSTYDEDISARNRIEARKHAEFISYCFNNSDKICK